jgi:hypothetical protein
VTVKEFLKTGPERGPAGGQGAEEGLRVDEKRDVIEALDSIHGVACGDGHFIVSQMMGDFNRLMARTKELLEASEVLSAQDREDLEVMRGARRGAIKKCVKRAYTVIEGDFYRRYGESVWAPRVMRPDEVCALREGDVVWLEDVDRAGVVAGIVDTVFSVPDMVVFTLGHGRCVQARMLEYGVRWRAWTDRPDDATLREAARWREAQTCAQTQPKVD